MATSGFPSLSKLYSGWRSAIRRQPLAHSVATGDLSLLKTGWQEENGAWQGAGDPTPEKSRLETSDFLLPGEAKRPAQLLPALLLFFLQGPCLAWNWDRRRWTELCLGGGSATRPSQNYCGNPTGIKLASSACKPLLGGRTCAWPGYWWSHSIWHRFARAICLPTAVSPPSWQPRPLQVL